MLPDTPNQELLQNKQALEEIARHQWIESEKAGHDVGFEYAVEDWLRRFSKDWVAYNLPKQRSKEESSANSSSPNKRKAKSYFIL